MFTLCFLFWRRCFLSLLDLESPIKGGGILMLHNCWINEGLKKWVEVSVLTEKVAALFSGTGLWGQQQASSSLSITNEVRMRDTLFNYLSWKDSYTKWENKPKKFEEKVALQVVFYKEGWSKKSITCSNISKKEKKVAHPIIKIWRIYCIYCRQTEPLFGHHKSLP